MANKTKRIETWESDIL